MVAKDCTGGFWAKRVEARVRSFKASRELEGFTQYVVCSTLGLCMYLCIYIYTCYAYMLHVEYVMCIYAYIHSTVCII